MTTPISDEVTPSDASGLSTFFLSQRTGRWKWPWLFLSLPASVIASMITLGAFVAALVLSDTLGFDWATEASSYFDSDADVATNPAVVSVELLGIGLPLWAAAVVGSYVHRRSARSLITPLTDFRWSIVRRLLCFSLLALCLNLLTLVVISLTGFLPASDLQFTGFEQAHLAWLLPIAFITLIQTSGEEVFFKGYILRQLGAATRVFWVAPIFVAVIFTAIHIGNPDLNQTWWLTLPLFAASELVIMYLMIRTGGLEAPLVLHWVNNVQIFLLIAERTTQANDLTLFVFDEGQPTLTEEVINSSFFLLYLAALLIACIWRRSPFYLERHNWKPQDTQP